ncbi:DUF943 family protein [Serratia rhizosphaerae]|uniref:DUF943 family protein n=1 Tax=Serratia rhizosphaerae TaxID=2597702 RepID=A0ABX6GPC0_9GAMM|nr:DUF943 family protein [Serratia rhizosphaerae]QHA88105.1 DUF943 family protein [Serratia rhizosphaerae]
MRDAKSAKGKVFFIFISAVFTVFLLYLMLRPVKIIGFHSLSDDVNVILVDNFPLTDKGKIDWWLKNEKKLEEMNEIPDGNGDGYYHIDFLDFGDGYKEEGKYDRLCFYDMNTEKNCIDKNIVFSVSKSRNLGTVFTTYEGRYRLGKNDEIIEDKISFKVW